ncbi:peptidase M29 [Vandammella animalimorsus]|uniref:Peptidase M29 n=1 Tax=Vandammella animalimorsus TaxID=2029117 RepID=A0A2A2AA65_9BURK|nr:peptidase M29 [Vandammella animalimorsus]PAT31905.1 peptidase M29 [Vandammella animalimorsus]PAT34638.1 peptidase M29 [Vandammella animalimorsus]PAX16448.1 peptidase M29 [Vandammella animalimorsus]PAX18863.1 peptidase M29 [Vandammella animalimorsus]
MLIERVEGKWVADFVQVFGLCKVRRGEVAAILSESQSRSVLVELAELALEQMGAKVFHVRLPSPRLKEAAPLRSTGTSLAIEGLEPVIAALSSSDFIVDCTVEGLLHAVERTALLARGARIMMISNEHPEILERLKPCPVVHEKCQLGAQMITDARTMRVTSRAGTDLTVDLTQVPGRGSAGIADRPGSFGYWPAGLCICYPSNGSVNGTLVLDCGDVNLTFKRYLEAPVTLRIENDFVVAIEGDGLDAQLLCSYYSSWEGRDAYAISHVGWGMAPAARWDALVMYDKRDTNGTELRAFAGNFLISTGANPAAGRFTSCHFDYPMRNCTVSLDGQEVVREGVLQGVLA